MVKKVISGGQTGADQGGLKAAWALGILTGGWIPKGWRTDNGPDPGLAIYGLVETADDGYPNRTKRNVKDSNGTVLFGDISSPGCKLTIKLCRNIEHIRPYICNPTPSELREWIEEHNIHILNVAGNRERTHPGIGSFTRIIIQEALK